MNALAIFSIEVVVSLLVSAIVLARLHALLHRIGNEVCERANRGATEFWVAYTQLMMVIAPVLLVAYFSKAGTYYELVDQVKSSLALVLVGQFGGLVLVGRAVWNSIVRPAAKPVLPAAPANPLVAA